MIPWKCRPASGWSLASFSSSGHVSLSCSAAVVPSAETLKRFRICRRRKYKVQRQFVAHLGAGRMLRKSAMKNSGKEISGAAWDTSMRSRKNHQEQHLSRASSTRYSHWREIIGTCPRTCIFGSIIIPWHVFSSDCDSIFGVFWKQQRSRETCYTGTGTKLA